MSSWCSAPLWTCADVINPGYRRRKPPLMQKTLLAVAKNPSTVAKNPPSTVAENPQHRPSQKTPQPTHRSKKPPLPTQKTRNPFFLPWALSLGWVTKPHCQIWRKMLRCVLLEGILFTTKWVFPKIGVPPKSSILIGVSIIFTIHFGG